MEILIFINQYIKYVYWLLIAGILASLIYLLVNLKPVFRDLGILGNGAGQMSAKLAHVKECTEKISATVNRVVPLIAGLVGVSTLLKIFAHVMKKGDDNKRHIAENLAKEIDMRNRKAAGKKLVSEVAKTARTISSLTRQI